MKLSKTTEYAVRTVIYLASHEGINSASTICEACNIPYKYFQKISSMLNHGNLLTIARGKYGGFTLAKNPESISMSAILDAMTEPENLEPACRLFGDLCIYGEEYDSCVLRQTLLDVERYQKSKFDELFLSQLANGSNACCAYEKFEENEPQSLSRTREA